MTRTIKLLDVVALIENLPDKSLGVGQVGTIVETLAPDVWLVEFSNDRGQTYAIESLKSDQMISLLFVPMVTQTNLAFTPLFTT